MTYIERDALITAGVMFAPPEVDLLERGKLANLLNAAILYGIQRHGEVVSSADANSYSFAADYLLAHGVTVQEWVSVEDALPTLNEVVIGYDKRFGVHACMCEGFIWSDNVPALTMPTHWMPLPAPPKEE